MFRIWKKKWILAWPCRPAVSQSSEVPLELRKIRCRVTMWVSDSKCNLRTTLLKFVSNLWTFVAYRCGQSGVQVTEPQLPGDRLKPGFPYPHRLLTLRNLLSLFHVSVHCDQEKIVTMTSRNQRRLQVDRIHSVERIWEVFLQTEQRPVQGEDLTGKMLVPGPWYPA